MEEDEWLPPAQAADYASRQKRRKISPDYLKHLRQKGILYGRKINSQMYLYRKSDILALSFDQVRVDLGPEIEDLSSLKSLEAEISYLDKKRRRNRTRRANGHEETLA